LLVPEITLAADTTSGNRPSFTHAAPALDAKRWFEEFVRVCSILSRCARGTNTKMRGVGGHVRHAESRDHESSGLVAWGRMGAFLV
jgi:hypothetical protein